jgi:nucleoside-diphosphate-sugar epimerase
VLGLDLVSGRYTTHLGNIKNAALVDSLVRQVAAVIHTASLHAPHVQTRSRRDFIATNIEGTQRLLEAAIKQGVSKFVYTSTTSLYGAAMVSAEQAVWVTEELTPMPRDIYDETKLEAEACCREATRRHGLPCVSLRISRCFREPDELMAIYRLHRGVDLRDVAEAHRLALHMHIPRFEIFNISARPPFEQDDTMELLHNAPAVIRRRCPELERKFTMRGWRLPPSIDRVYVIEKAMKELAFVPLHNYDSFINCKPSAPVSGSKPGGSPKKSVRCCIAIRSTSFHTARSGWKIFSGCASRSKIPTAKLWYLSRNPTT